MRRPIVNIADLQLVPLAAMSAKAGGSPPPERFGGSMAQIGRTIGAAKLGYNLTVLPPGTRAFPFHSHRINEEMFFVIAGTGEIRIGDERHAIRAGDVIACPPGGPETGHQIANTAADGELRFFAVSTLISPEICEYADSGKFAISADFGTDAGGKAQGFRFIGRAAQSLDYWDGE